MPYGVVFFLAIFAFATVAIDTNAKKNNSVFVPTKEWQIVEKGQPITRGLHIKHDLTTGVTQAKLIDDEESNDKSEDNENSSQTNSLTLHPEESLSDEDDQFTKDLVNNRIKIPVNKLKEMMKKIKSDETESVLQSETNNPTTKERRKKFRSYTELKEELESLHMNVSTHSELITGLFNLFEPHKESITTDNLDSSKIDDILDILNNMEYLLHQIDNAQIFTDMGGMAKVISPSLNSTNHIIKAEALKLLGVAVQSNPKVQMKALENDYVQKILHMLTINNKVIVKSRSLFALGALVRNFPAAQKTLVNNGGLQIFGKILADGQSNLQTRVMDLVNDLTIERKNLKLIEDEVQKLRKVTDYNLTNFEQNLLSQKYCQNLVDLMIRSLQTYSKIDNFHDLVYDSTVTLSTICKDEIMNKEDEILREIDKNMNDLHSKTEKVDMDDTDSHLSHIWVLHNMRNIVVNNRQHDEL